MARKPPAPPAVGEPAPILHTIKQVADRLAVSPRTVHRLIAQGALPVHRIGRAVRVSEDDLARFLAARRHT
jgi:excisionase family DNA binding protein